MPSDTIYCSDILDGESFDLAGNSIRVGGGDGDPIVALTSWFDFNLLVFKERSIWVVNANPAQSVAEWQIRLINNRVGCVAARTVQQVGSDVLFMSRDGVRSVKTIESGAQTDISQPLSSPINDLVGQINQSAISKCAAVYWRNRYLIAVPLGSATEPDHVLCYHLLASSWTGFWTGWQPRDWVITAFGGKLRLNFGDQSGKLFTWDDFTAENSTTLTNYQDGGTDYESYIKTRAYRFGETWGDKISHSVQFNLENIHSTDISADLDYYKDLSSTESELASNVTIAANSNLVRKGYNLIPKGRFNQMQFKVKADSDALQFTRYKRAHLGNQLNRRDRPVDGTSARNFGVGDVIDFIRGNDRRGTCFGRWPNNILSPSSASPPTLEVSTSRKMASWSQSVLQDRSMKTIWIGIGYPKKGKALLSSSKTYYQKTSKGWKLSSMNLHRGIPIGVKKNCSPLDMVKGRGFNPN